MFFGISLVYDRKSMLFSFLKVLIVFHATPLTAPLEAIRFKHFLAKVVLVDFVWKIFGPIQIIRCRAWLNKGPFDVRILQRIDVDSHAEGVSRQGFGSSDGSVVEAGGVVSLHGCLVRSIEFINQTDAVDWVFKGEQRSEDTEQVVGNRFVANQLPFFDAAIKIVMIDREIAELIIADGGVGWHRLTLHTVFHPFGYGLRHEQVFFIPQCVVGLGMDVMRYKDNKNQAK